jgi:hypothetical protein
MSETTRDFPLWQVLTVSTGRLLGDIGGLYEVVNHLTGDNISTIGLLAAGPPCKAAVLAQHPQLADVDASGVHPGNWQAWLAEQEAQFGASLPLARMDAWEPRSIADDILDVIRINPKAQIMAVEP